MVTPVILDVDTGIDDSLALMLAITHPELDVRAVTCVGGNVAVDQVVVNTLRTLDLVDAPTVPVARGMSDPIIGTPAGASHFHGLDGLADISLPLSARTVDPRSAIRLLRELLDESTGDITVIALAPLTNLAMLIRLYPESARKIKRIVWMGGAAQVGNVTPVAEYNAWQDPEAAHIVLSSAIPVTVYPLEPFYTVAVRSGDIDRLEAHDHPRARVLSALLKHIARANAGEDRLPAPGSATLGDAGAVCALLAPQLTTTITAEIGMETRGQLTRGQTVIDLRRAVADIRATPELPGDFHTSRATIVRSADARAFVEMFFQHVCPGFQPHHHDREG